MTSRLHSATVVSAVLVMERLSTVERQVSTKRRPYQNLRRALEPLEVTVDLLYPFFYKRLDPFRSKLLSLFLHDYSSIMTEGHLTHVHEKSVFRPKMSKFPKFYIGGVVLFLLEDLYGTWTGYLLLVTLVFVDVVRNVIRCTNTCTLTDKIKTPLVSMI